jgi:hypothetical protein
MGRCSRAAILWDLSGGLGMGIDLKVAYLRSIGNAMKINRQIVILSVLLIIFLAESMKLPALLLEPDSSYRMWQFWTLPEKLGLSALFLLAALLVSNARVFLYSSAVIGILGAVGVMQFSPLRPSPYVEGESPFLFQPLGLIVVALAAAGIFLQWRHDQKLKENDLYKLK